MTRKLYYEDAYLTEFDTEVRKVDQDNSGRYYAVLEETAFYPTGGGQPHDTGSLNGLEVTDVEEIDGEIRHYLSERFPAELITIHGSVNWERRYDHMQQHNGQHIVSAVFQDRFGVPTTSFHLGKDTVTIDLDTDNLTGELLRDAEERVNKIIRNHLEIEAKWVDVEEANKYPLRKSLSVEEDVRLVIIPGVDYNGCGGTHPQSTSEVMAVKFLGWTRNKKQVRLEFACGNRVLNKLEEKHRIVTDLKQLVRRPEDELTSEVNSILLESKEKDRKITELEEQLIKYEAKQLMSNIPADGVVYRVYKHRPIKDLQSLGKAVVASGDIEYVVLVSEQEDQLQFVLAHGDAVEQNLNHIAKKIFPIIEGKGGGKPNFVQGGGKKLIEADELVTKMKQAINDCE
ncbi:alanyl-tRNA synthetase [Pontibacillus halophilus JSM 076056 = DSM 19796]|uniref:Alanyl-tRNA synthetase n=1 Tax=Pontibacillus halophilus JSM 076056 = DSM 19796 TaxID=1385510 RepID=A0A0A5GRX4_9BACI|nr:serine-tRNA(Ala) deacylase AlaX [Pontibacillus halophilus]KGX93915.1 alanyl-tRNA synthetase [Pontibacillus halophilus JSM 076056 = DSM 19796]